MSESVVVEVYENQMLAMKGWAIHPKHPWSLKSLEKCAPPDEIALPGGDWSWASNWRIDKRPGLTDDEGWEYASKIARFTDSSRVPKTEKLWNDKARRRLWTRIMRREVGISKVADVTRVMPKIQMGLKSVHAARIRIEEIMKQAPEAAETEQMQTLVQSVKKNIADITCALDQIQKQQGSTTTHTAVIKKLRNDVIKEEIAMERAFYPNGGSDKKDGFLPLRKYGSNSERRSSATVISDGGGGGSNTNPFDETSSNSFSSSSSIKSGRAGAFNPSLLGSSFSSKSLGLGPNGEGAEDGVFVDRSMHELMIEQRLRPVDEATVMQEIIEERTIEINKVNKGLIEVQEMFADLSRIVKEQQIEIDTIFENCEESNAKTKEAHKNVLEANRLQKEGFCAIL